MNNRVLVSAYALFLLCSACDDGGESPADGSTQSDAEVPAADAAASDAAVNRDGGTLDATADAALNDADGGCKAYELSCGNSCVGDQRKDANGCHLLGHYGRVEFEMRADTDHLYFASSRSTSSFWKLPLAGGAAQPVTGDLGIGTHFALAGDNLVFTTYGNPNLRTISKSGGQPTSLATLSGTVHAFDVTGNQIVIGTYADKGGTLSAYDLDGKNARSLVTMQNTWDARIVGSSVLYVVQAAFAGLGPIKSVSITGGATTTVLEGEYSTIGAVHGGQVFGVGQFSTIRRAPVGGGAASTWLQFENKAENLTAMPSSLNDIARIMETSAADGKLYVLAEFSDPRDSYVILRGNLDDAVIKPERLITFATGGEIDAFAVVGSRAYLSISYSGNPEDSKGAALFGLDL